MPSMELHGENRAMELERYRAGQRQPFAEMQRIAVLRANALGDFVVALPALAALRAAYPEAEIVLLAKHWHRQFLQGWRGPVDRVEVVPPLRGVSADETHVPSNAERNAVEAFLDRLRGQHFDLALQMHGGGRYSNPFVQAFGARVAAGLRAPDAVALDINVPYRYYQSEVMRYLELVRMVGAQPVDLEPRLTATRADLQEADDLLAELGYRDGSPLALLHPGAGDPRRRWPEPAFAAVARALGQHRARVLLIGDEQDQPLADAVVRISAGAAVSVAGRLSLGGLLGLLSRADLAVCNDSGPHHLAVALGTPTVGIFWAGNVINAGPLTRSRHRVVLSWRLQCPACGQDCTAGRCGHRDSFVAEASVDEVIAEALDLLSSPRVHGNRDCSMQAFVLPITE